ncbi:MAG TPA: DNA polymerase Y family protein [Burkholderiales bacterium]|nr:DNA polymerase Y family protein [Burkholderiales bacterium]
MLWLALHFPLFALETLSRGRVPRESVGAPWAIADGREVLACDARAQALGVRPGIGLVAAWALAPRLYVRQRDEAAERAALEGIAAWACRFTPYVSLEPPQGVLMEIEDSLRLYHGLDALTGLMRDGLEEMGYSTTLAVAPAARGAWWLALAGCEQSITDLATLETALAALPVAAVCLDQDAHGFLRSVGVATVGELLALPREGVGRRLGRALLESLERASGRMPEPRTMFVPPTRFSAKLELYGEVEHAEGVLFAARRLLVQLEGVLAARQAGVRRFCLVLLHRAAPAHVVEVGLASPGRATDRFMQLLREKLSTIALSRPVEAIRIEATAFEPLHGRTVGLFRDVHAEREDWVRLIERLQARLGGDAVHGLGVLAEHRPERAWRALDADEQPLREEARAGARPLWLIEPPRRLQEADGVPHDDGRLELLVGPERIESGWWDGGEVARDYFIARAPSSALLWIFRERGGSWYLHGLFA